MYVRKFQGESIDETIKEIKRELGPEAIILKTETFKGIKSALKKSKVEITAAITEKNLRKKMNVDKALGSDNRNRVYDAPAEQLVDLINDYDETNENIEGKNFGYGGISLNRTVQRKNDENIKVVNELVDVSSLDNFLYEEKKVSPARDIKINESLERGDIYEEKNIRSAQKKQPLKLSSIDSDDLRDLYDEIKKQVLSEIKDSVVQHDGEVQINELQQEIESLRNSINSIRSKSKTLDDEIQGVINILSRSGVSEEYINKKLLRPYYELSDKGESRKNSFVDFCIDECKKIIRIENLDVKSSFPKAYIYFSPSGSGQSTLIKKIIKRRSHGEIFTLVNDERKTNLAADKILGINNVCCSDPAKLFSIVRRCLSRGTDAHIDLTVNDKNMNDIFQIINLFKSQSKSTVAMVTISGRFGHRFNSRIISKFKDFATIFNLTFYDECLEPGSILNLFDEFSDLKLGFISSGEEIPTDLSLPNDNEIIEKIFNV